MTWFVEIILFRANIYLELRKEAWGDIVLQFLLQFDTSESSNHIKKIVAEVEEYLEGRRELTRDKKRKK